jgi:hypothetical protein
LCRGRPEDSGSRGRRHLSFDGGEVDQVGRRKKRTDAHAKEQLIDFNRRQMFDNSDP